MKDRSDSEKLNFSTLYQRKMAAIARVRPMKASIFIMFMGFHFGISCTLFNYITFLNNGHKAIAIVMDLYEIKNSMGVDTKCKLKYRDSENFEVIVENIDCRENFFAIQDTIPILISMSGDDVLLSGDTMSFEIKLLFYSLLFCNISSVGMCHYVIRWRRRIRKLFEIAPLRVTPLRTLRTVG